MASPILADLKRRRPTTYATYLAIARAVAADGFAPSLRQLAQAIGVTSPATAKYHMDILVDAGLIRRVPGAPRAIELLATEDPEPASPHHADIVTIPLPTSTSDGQGAVEVPLVGRIAAGAPILADQHVDDVVTLPRQLTGSGELFMLEVRGDSMIDAAICDGDFVVIRSQPTANNGEIVAAMIDGEATVKVLATRDGHRWLDPRNSSYAPIPGDDATILGRVVTVMRAL
ncbi:transcriptional repressor LexA [Nanchangia anserum]|uniref:LexA repressor n=1 Tax=Nanchangia anserum TaxID=2692125 RepID=A0A8I0G981_9ACTO|nr:transcriptional repressor LexA [Nanchangia anserum]MBD3690255.1 transcriptional repressor LexA [Nanchangia anserum]